MYELNPPAIRMNPLSLIKAAFGFNFSGRMSSNLFLFIFHFSYLLMCNKAYNESTTSKKKTQYNNTIYSSQIRKRKNDFTSNYHILNSTLLFVINRANTFVYLLFFNNINYMSSILCCCFFLHFYRW